MDQPAADVPDESEQPEDQQNHEYCPEHISSQAVLFTISTAVFF